MSDQNSYETLGLDESSSFDEIQAARNRLVEEHAGDRKHVETIEAAYDAILMERLRLRQEGKIKVPDRIRFAETATEEPSLKITQPTPTPPNWLQQWLDTPAREDILQPALVFAVLTLLGVYSASLALALGVGGTVYFLNRKEHKLGRAVLLSLAGLVCGLVIGLAIGQFLIPQGLALPWLTTDAIAASITFVVFWLISSFLR